MRVSGNPRVVIVGAGFGGLKAARLLGKSGIEVLLIDRNNYHSAWGNPGRASSYGELRIPAALARGVSTYPRLAASPGNTAAIRSGFLG